MYTKNVYFVLNIIFCYCDSKNNYVKLFLFNIPSQISINTLK